MPRRETGGASPLHRLQSHRPVDSFGTMIQVLDNIEAGRLVDELRRRGITPEQRVRAVIETVPDGDPSITAMNAQGGAFDFLADA